LIGKDDIEAEFTYSTLTGKVTYSSKGATGCSAFDCNIHYVTGDDKLSGAIRLALGFDGATNDNPTGYAYVRPAAEDGDVNAYVTGQRGYDGTSGRRDLYIFCENFNNGYRAVAPGDAPPGLYANNLLAKFPMTSDANGSFNITNTNVLLPDMGINTLKAQKPKQRYHFYAITPIGSSSYFFWKQNVHEYNSQLTVQYTSTGVY